MQKRVIYKPPPENLKRPDKPSPGPPTPYTKPTLTEHKGPFEMLGAIFERAEKETIKAIRSEWKRMGERIKWGR